MPNPDPSVPVQPATLPVEFVAIEERPASNRFWAQARAEWVGLLEADHYPTADHARELLAAQPYMHSFFKEAILRGFSITPSGAAPLPALPTATA